MMPTTPTAPVPAAASEGKRMAALRKLRILDTPAEPAFDDIVLLASQICGTPIGLVSLIDDDRQWFKARVGLEAAQTPRQLAFCAHAITAPDALLIVEDATHDPRFSDNPLVTGEPGIRFYAGMPIVSPDGQALGTVCVIDTVPRVLDAAQSGALRALARQTNALLALRHARLAAEQQARATQAQSARAEQEQRRSAELLDMVLRGANLGLWDLHAPSGRFSTNERERAMLGYDAAGARPEQLRWRSLVHPDDRPTIDAAIGGPGQGDADSYTCEHRMRHRDGGWVWVLVHATIVERNALGVPLRIVGTHMDITERKAAEQALADSRRRLQLITANLPAFVSHIDAEQRYTFLSDHIRRVFGLDTAAALGKTMREVRGEATYAQLSAHVEAALRGEEVAFAYTDQAQGRDVRYQSNYVPDIDAAGRVQGFYAMTFDITALHETQRQLELLARVDTLTGLPNRRQFDERIEESLLRTKRLQQRVAVMFVDIDRFKHINDTLGHACGDAVLREFARRLKACVRATDSVARLGGDEFVVLLEGVGDLHELGALAAKVVGCIRPPFEVDGTALAVTTSIGVASCSAGEADAATLLARADVALYEAKRQGRDRYTVA